MGNQGRRSISRKAVARAQNKLVKSTFIKKNDGKPRWRFSCVDRNGPFAWPKGDPKELEIVQKLHDFDSMDWNNIKGAKHHYISDTARLSKEAIKRLSEIELDDEIDNLFSFHLQGKPRIICIVHNDTAHLLWHDPEHQVAPSKKKNT